LESLIQVHIIGPLIGMLDYNSNDIVDIYPMLGECRDNYRRTAALYHQKFLRRKHYPNDSMIRIIEHHEQRRNR